MVHDSNKYNKHNHPHKKIDDMMNCPQQWAYILSFPKELILKAYHIVRLVAKWTPHIFILIEQGVDLGQKFPHWYQLQF